MNTVSLLQTKRSNFRDKQRPTYSMSLRLINRIINNIKLKILTLDVLKAVNIKLMALWGVTQ
jgi:hypothetical protein